MSEGCGSSAEFIGQTATGCTESGEQYLCIQSRWQQTMALRGDREWCHRVA
ncbi:MAG: hypothetical protein U0M75_11455 [Lachnospiraceae bacterium]